MVHTLVLLYHPRNIDEAHKLIFFAEQRGLVALEKKGNLLNCERYLLSISNSSVYHIKIQMRIEALTQTHILFQKSLR